MVSKAIFYLFFLNFILYASGRHISYIKLLPDTLYYDVNYVFDEFNNQEFGAEGRLCYVGDYEKFKMCIYNKVKNVSNQII
jgi:hypothetical protein